MELVMDLVLHIAGSLALLIALLFTLAMAGATSFYTMRKPSGPDAMGLASLFIGGIAGWVILAIGAGIAAGQGSLAWAAPDPAAAVILAIVCVVGLGGVSLVGIGASLETRLALRTPIGLAAGLVLPAITIMYCGALLWVPPAVISEAVWSRFFAIPLAAISAASWGMGAVMYARALRARERAAREREVELERAHQECLEDARRRDAEHAAQLAAMPDDAPLAEFVTHLFIDKSEEHHSRALRRIGALPDITRRIEELLSDAVPLQREYCANYIRMCDAPDPALAPAVGRAITLLAEDIERAAPTGELTHAKGMTQGILMTAQKFPGARFDAEVTRLRAALEKWPHESTRDEALALVDRFFKRELVELSN
jgi:hypothetical protein